VEYRKRRLNKALSLLYLANENSECVLCCSLGPLFTGSTSNAAKIQIVGNKSIQMSKISILALQGRIVSPIYVKFGTESGSLVRLAVQNFTPIGARWRESGPKIAKISTFW